MAQMNVYVCEDDAGHTAFSTEATTISGLASERGITGNYTASMNGRVVGPETELSENVSVAFVTARKTGGEA